MSVTGRPAPPTMSSLRRFRRWLVWFGGWESEVRGWSFTHGPTPISLLGHRFTIFGGGWLKMRLGRGTLNVFLPGGSHRRSVPGCHAYWSPNGTPGHERARLILGNREKWEASRA